ARRIREHGWRNITRYVAGEGVRKQRRRLGEVDVRRLRKLFGLGRLRRRRARLACVLLRRDRGRDRHCVSGLLRRRWERQQGNHGNNFPYETTADKSCGHSSSPKLHKLIQTTNLPFRHPADGQYAQSDAAVPRRDEDTW